MHITSISLQDGCVSRCDHTCRGDVFADTFRAYPLLILLSSLFKTGIQKSYFYVLEIRSFFGLKPVKGKFSFFTLSNATDRCQWVTVVNPGKRIDYLDKRRYMLVRYETECMFRWIVESISGKPCGAGIAIKANYGYFLSRTFTLQWKSTIHWHGALKKFSL